MRNNKAILFIASNAPLNNRKLEKWLKRGVDFSFLRNNSMITSKDAVKKKIVLTAAVTVLTIKTSVFRQGVIIVASKGPARDTPTGDPSRIMNRISRLQRLNPGDMALKT